MAINYEKIRKRFLPMTETMFYILLSIRQERHGYGIMKHVKELTGGRIELGAGTVYQSLKKLEGDGLIMHTQEVEARKNYIITEIGEKILIEETARIKEIYNNLGSIL